MDAARLGQVEAIFNELIAAPPEKRGALLEQRCGSDAEIRMLVTRLIASDSNGMGDFLSTPAFVPPAEEAPRRVGRYRVLRELGRGGMGVVYEAEQDTPRRTVAVKLIRSGLTSRESLRRFRHEAEILGHLTHPGIAQVYDAGTTDVDWPAGPGAPQPFLAMELVRGQPLQEYAEAERLNVAGRLALLARVCDAVHHAHQKGVIHCDLKPGNILVTESGPKILDFGVARATSPELQSATLRSGAAELIGTIAYMSPEQLAGDLSSLDTRSDVYALGVVGFELLTGQPAFDVSDKSVPHAIRMICEQDARSAGGLRAELRGDIEAILGKAMAKAPEQRYASAAELAADIRRYLTRQPVTARAPSGVYQLFRFAQRHRGLVGGSALALIALVIGAIATATFAVRASHSAERARLNLGRAQNEAARARTVVGFLSDMLASVDPALARGEDVTVRQILDDAAQRIDGGQLRAEPEVEATLRSTIGEAYLHLVMYAEAERHLQRALQMRRDELGLVDGDTVRLYSLLVQAISGTGDFERSVALEREALEVARQVHGPRHAAVAEAMNNLATTLSRLGRMADAEEMHRRALAMRRLYAEDDPSSLAQSLSNLGALLHTQGRLVEADTLLREALEIRRVHLHSDHPALATTLNNLGTLSQERGDLDEAEALLTEALGILRRIHPEANADVAWAMNNLAVLLRQRGKHDEAVQMLRETAAIQREVLGDHHPDLGGTYANIAAALTIAGDRAEADRMGRLAVETLKGAYGGPHPHVAIALHNLASGRMQHGVADGAEDMLRESVGMLRGTLGPANPATAHVRNTLGSLLILLGRYDEAVEVLEAVLADRRAALGEAHPKVGVTGVALAAARLYSGDFAGAMEVAGRAVALLGNEDGAQADLATGLLVRAEATMQAETLGDDAADVAAWIEAAIAIRQRLFGPDAWEVADARRAHALWLAHEGHRDEALALLNDVSAALDCDAAEKLLHCRHARRLAEAAIHVVEGSPGPQGAGTARSP